MNANANINTCINIYNINNTANGLKAKLQSLAQL